MLRLAVGVGEGMMSTLSGRLVSCGIDDAFGDETVLPFATDDGQNGEQSPWVLGSSRPINTSVPD
jgi:hypothetical protein